MKLSTITRVAALAALLIPASAGAADKDKKDGPGQMVDSGSLGVFTNGHRIATETFSIQQSSNGSVISSQFKTEEGVDKAAQSSELQLSTTGEIRKYEWKELSPGKATATVAPSNDYLTEHITGGPGRNPRINRSCFPPRRAYWMIMSLFIVRFWSGGIWPAPANRKKARCSVRRTRRPSLER